jgi:hypothetical protein
MKTEDLQIKSFQALCVSNLIPNVWDDWFWLALAVNKSFAWGHNNTHSLMPAAGFKTHLIDIIDERLQQLQVKGKELKTQAQVVYDILDYLETKDIFIDT